MKVHRSIWASPPKAPSAALLVHPRGPVALRTHTFLENARKTREKAHILNAEPKCQARLLILLTERRIVVVVLSESMCKLISSLPSLLGETFLLGKANFCEG